MSVSAAWREEKEQRKARRRRRMQDLLTAAAVTSVTPHWEDTVGIRCRGADPLLFETADADTCPRRSGYADANAERHAAAARICGPCPVKKDCLTTALRREYVGTWGGVLITAEDWESAHGLKKEIGL